MKTIYKYKLTLKHNQGVPIPKNAKILHVDIQSDNLYFWAEVDTEEVITYRYFSIFGTGWDIPSEENIEYVYIGTVKEQDDLIWHLYEMIET